jgi:hypothetical protein
MDICKNALRYMCKELISYCVNSCNFTNDDDKVPYTKAHICYCNCTDQDNYNKLCNYDNMNYQITITIGIIFGVISLCILCTIYRVCMLGCHNDYSLEYQGLVPNNQEHNTSIITSYSHESRYLSSTSSTIPHESTALPSYVEIDCTLEEVPLTDYDENIQSTQHPPPYLVNYSLYQSLDAHIINNGQEHPPKYPKS